MSNLGFHFLLSALASAGTFKVERFFLDTAPVTLESGEPIRRADALAFTLSYEEDLLNIVRILHRSRLEPLRDRRQGRPLVMVGGPAATANPLPVSVVADIVVLGEGEVPAGEIVRVLETTGDREPAETLERLADIPGIFVPGLTETGVSFAPPYADTDFPHSVIVTPATVFADTVLVEISRGCPGACSFCMATALYGPFRTMPVDRLRDVLTPLAGRIHRIGLVSTAVAAHPDFSEVVRLVETLGMVPSFGSLRAADVGEEQARIVGTAGTRSVSLAPESGSEAIRFRLGKRIGNERFFEAGRRLRHAGVRNFALYLLAGCPGESDESLAETESFLCRFREAIGGACLAVHVNALVPKAWTPLQFYALPEQAQLEERITRCKELARRAGARARSKSVRSTLRQAVLSLGGTEAGRAVVYCAAQGLTWRRACEAAGVDTRFPHATKGEYTRFPWDSIAGPVRKRTLRARFEAVTGTSV